MGKLSSYLQEPAKEVSLEPLESAVRGLEGAVRDIPAVDMPDLTPAIEGFKEALAASSAKHDDALMGAVNTLIGAIEGISLSIAAPNVTVESVFPVDELVETLRGLVPEQKAVRFEIQRDNNGYLQSVIARPEGGV